MSYFIGQVIITYDGYEFMDKHVIEAKSKKEAIKKLNEIDWKHDDTEETQEIGAVVEVSQEEFSILNKYI